MDKNLGHQSLEVFKGERMHVPSCLLTRLTTGQVSAFRFPTWIKLRTLFRECYVERISKGQGQMCAESKVSILHGMVLNVGEMVLKENAYLDAMSPDLPLGGAQIQV